MLQKQKVLIHQTCLLLVGIFLSPVIKEVSSPSNSESRATHFLYFVCSVLMFYVLPKLVSSPKFDL